MPAETVRSSTLLRNTTSQTQASAKVSFLVVSTYFMGGLIRWLSSSRFLELPPMIV
jgi:hypothetical protein